LRNAACGLQCVRCGITARMVWTVEPGRPPFDVPCAPVPLYRVAWQDKRDGREGAGLWTRGRALAESIHADHADRDADFDFWIEETTERVDARLIMEGG